MNTLSISQPDYVALLPFTVSRLLRWAGVTSVADLATHELRQFGLGPAGEKEVQDLADQFGVEIGSWPYWKVHWTGRLLA